MQANDPALSEKQNDLLRAEQLKLLHEAILLPISVSVILACVLVAFEWQQIEHSQLLSWLFVFIMVSLARLKLAYAYRQAQPKIEQHACWETYFLIGSISAAVLWGSTAWLLFPEHSITHQVFLAFMVGGICIGAIPSLSSLSFAIISYILIALIPLIIRFFTLATETSSLIAAMLVLFLLMMLISAKRIHSHIRQNIWLRMQSQMNESIVAASEAHFRKSSEILEMAAMDVPDEKIYDAICHMYEASHPSMRASILKLKGNHLYHCSAPSLPKEYCDAINGVEIGPSVGSCGTAAFRGSEVIVEDISSHPLWASYKQVALPYHLYACWSIPIKGRDGKIFGTFAMYFEHPASPSDLEMASIRDASRLVSIIMEREQREASLRILSQSIEQAGESVLITDKEGTIEYVNSSFCRLTGYRAEEVMGKNPRVLKSGNQSEAYYENMWRTITDGKVWSRSIIDRRKDGSEYPAMMSVAPIFKDEKITHYVAIQQDMTEHQLLDEKFRQAQKMEALGGLVGGIAHDFNNMLAGITGNIYLLKTMVQDNPKAMEKLDAVDCLGFRAADMIQQLLIFARKGRIQMKPFGLISFFKEVSKLSQSSIPENITFRQSYIDKELIIRGDATQLQQVLMNLLTNARDALAGINNPEISLVIDEVEASERLSEAFPELHGNIFARITVTDNGCGMGQSVKAHVFEPFFTTKEVGDGTGLGLSMAFGAIQNHGGAIEIISHKGKGTSVQIYLPADEKSSDMTQVKQTSIDFGKGELIMVVDDNADIRKTSTTVLQQLGYEVIEASDGLTAVTQFSAQSDKVALVLMDVVMPRLGGVQAIERMMKIAPSVKVIFTTGYDKDESLQSDMPSSKFPMISKPYNISQLSQLIRSQLDNRHQAK
ncbi:MAG: hypothetical protein CO186_03295 [Zetaproteobacteria bacterium CG_4_9_14_3_um_filter_49_83]|nr:MAG: hypothetical protein COW62_07510 [Zetaproteobacteria bacterium CG17_big_fil_post_rev_8_21_14_2_50_50_13]PIV31317.1 MAG: hypothetical protein COS35_02065 [Zetaproteobacteria bacterium CG02_land_8_20_14_3_00_50_9]PIY55071.1 MAG: hypothetical protein COZ00_11445 [Zetaproteobacteria bacterium CG_4_10_14_0_8_um_filter_49_80]PJA35946.1 MAG: hypothetical protein CO186_03295 [Zetaproteobacteria bacterium CG_4_9_14_3_um_filter_49_83]